MALACLGAEVLVLSDFAEGRRLLELPLEPGPLGSECLSFSPCGRLLALHRWRLEVVDLRRERVALCVEQGDFHGVSGAFTPSGTLRIHALEAGRLLRWDAEVLASDTGPGTSLRVGDRTIPADGPAPLVPEQLGEPTLRYQLDGAPKELEVSGGALTPAPQGGTWIEVTLRGSRVGSRTIRMGVVLLVDPETGREIAGGHPGLLDASGERIAVLTGGVCREYPVGAVPTPGRHPPTQVTVGPYVRIPLSQVVLARITGLVRTRTGAVAREGPMPEFLVFDLASGKSQSRASNLGRGLRILYAEPTGRTIFAADDEGRVRSLPIPENPAELHPGDGIVGARALSSNGEVVALGLDSGKVELRQADRAGEIRHLEGHEHAIVGLQFLPDGRLAVLDRSLRVGIWDPSTAKVERVVKGRTAEVAGTLGGGLPVPARPGGVPPLLVLPGSEKAIVWNHQANLVLVDLAGGVPQALGHQAPWVIPQIRGAALLLIRPNRAATRVYSKQPATSTAPGPEAGLLDLRTGGLSELSLPALPGGWAGGGAPLVQEEQGLILCPCSAPEGGTVVYALSADSPDRWNPVARLPGTVGQIAVDPSSGDVYGVSAEGVLLRAAGGAEGPGEVVEGLQRLPEGPLELHVKGRSILCSPAGGGELLARLSPDRRRVEVC